MYFTCSEHVAHTALRRKLYQLQEQVTDRPLLTLMNKVRGDKACHTRHRTKYILRHLYESRGLMAEYFGEQKEVAGYVYFECVIFIP